MITSKGLLKVWKWLIPHTEVFQEFPSQKKTSRTPGVPPERFDHQKESKQSKRSKTNKTDQFKISKSVSKCSNTINSPPEVPGSTPETQSFSKTLEHPSKVKQSYLACITSEGV
ncbi:hypothetical protein O181_105778 [Austropuccinia psidii MF-1]|uniref:Uncharacterized protein n=1 Tax=Austropuccinia psidii MF-1 TaxID=1389203 RepID=A0A9Q3JMP9_9BASI|nr:hypothetical protein [Austropuccinia psidii MF-1]